MRIDMTSLTARSMAARAHPMFKRIKQLAPACVLVTIPQPMAPAETLPEKSGGIILAPAYDERTRRLFGEMCEVLAVGPDCAPELAPGVRVIVNEFAGTQLIDSTSIDRYETPLAIISDGDIMAVLE